MTYYFCHQKLVKDADINSSISFTFKASCKYVLWLYEIIEKLQQKHWHNEYFIFLLYVNL